MEEGKTRREGPDPTYLPRHEGRPKQKVPTPDKAVNCGTFCRGPGELDRRSSLPASRETDRLSTSMEEYTVEKRIGDGACGVCYLVRRASAAHKPKRVSLVQHTHREKFEKDAPDANLFALKRVAVNRLKPPERK